MQLQHLDVVRLLLDARADPVPCLKSLKVFELGSEVEAAMWLNDPFPDLQGAGSGR